MKFESTPEHVGAGKPLEEAQETEKGLMAAIAENEEAAAQARRAGDFGRARALKQERETLLEQQRALLQGAAKNRSHKLAG